MSDIYNQPNKDQILKKLTDLQNEAVSEFKNKSNSAMTLLHECLSSENIMLSNLRFSNLSDFGNLVAEFEARLCTTQDIHDKLKEFSDNLDSSFKLYISDEIKRCEDKVTYYYDRLTNLEEKTLTLKEDFHSLNFNNASLDLLRELYYFII